MSNTVHALLHLSSKVLQQAFLPPGFAPEFLGCLAWGTPQGYGREAEPWRTETQACGPREAGAHLYLEEESQCQASRTT